MHFEVIYFSRSFASKEKKRTYDKKNKWFSYIYIYIYIYRHTHSWHLSFGIYQSNEKEIGKGTPWTNKNLYKVFISIQRTFQTLMKLPS